MKTANIHRNHRHFQVANPVIQSKLSLPLIKRAASLIAELNGKKLQSQEHFLHLVRQTLEWPQFRQVVVDVENWLSLLTPEELSSYCQGGPEAVVFGKDHGAPEVTELLFKSLRRLA